ncbi:hypothetical protein E2C01_065378 [Portunus trituberculatus]|uniref:Uncharacterized protein n=1 Tax=Portunus trituberculatus TaxID=210409 RepID=A0A5B7HN06_PORTR|nr:hypothetical protein [Portunus trituberculatus]
MAERPRIHTLSPPTQGSAPHAAPREMTKCVLKRLLACPPEWWRAWRYLEGLLGRRVSSAGAVPMVEATESIFVIFQAEWCGGGQEARA